VESDNSVQTFRDKLLVQSLRVEMCLDCLALESKVKVSKIPEQHRSDLHFGLSLK